LPVAAAHRQQFHQAGDIPNAERQAQGFAADLQVRHEVAEVE
jgi:hypothetical protein